MIPRIPRITKMIEIPSKTPQRLRLNLRLCSRFKLLMEVDPAPDVGLSGDHSAYLGPGPNDNAIGESLAALVDRTW